MEEEQPPLPLIIAADDVLALRRTRDEGRAELWGLVLSSSNLQHRVERTADAFVVKVHAIDFEQAEHAIEEYERENQPAKTVAEVLPVAERSYAGVALAVLLCAMFYVSGGRSGSSQWFARGAAVSELILHGQWWRTVTALSLHAGTGHLVGNVVACALFVTALFREVGPGVGSWLVLLSGAGGNLANALLHRHGHSSIGFSTAIFGAVGVLAAMSYMRRLRHGRPAWIALAAGLGILAMLGADKESDTMAHLFGFIVGTSIGLGVSSLPLLFRRDTVQAALTASALAAFVGCWLLAGAGRF